MDFKRHNSGVRQARFPATFSPEQESRPMIRCIRRGLRGTRCPVRSTKASMSPAIGRLSPCLENPTNNRSGAAASTSISEIVSLCAQVVAQLFQQAAVSLRRDGNRDGKGQSVHRMLGQPAEFAWAIDKWPSLKKLDSVAHLLGRHACSKLKKSENHFPDLIFLTMAIRNSRMRCRNRVQAEHIGIMAHHDA